MFNLMAIVNLPGGSSTQNKVYASLSEAEMGMIDLIEELGFEYYDVAPHGFELITVIITAKNGNVVENTSYTRDMFEIAHVGEVAKMAPCGCWLTVGAGRWGSSGDHVGCDKRVQTGFQL